MMKYAAVVISIVLAALYALGASYRSGFVRAFNLEYSQFPLPIEGVFYNGYFSAINISAGLISGLFALAACILCLSVVVIAISKHQATEQASNKFILSLRSIFSPKEVIPFLENSFVSFCFRVLCFTGLFLIALLILVKAMIKSDNVGQKYAKDYSQKMAAGDVPEKTLTFKEGVESRKGYTIICSSSQCAYQVEGKTIVYNHQDIISVTSEDESP